MADEDLYDIKTWFDGVSQGTSLEPLLPTSQDIDLQLLFDTHITDPLLQITSRKTLFFDEQVTVLIALKTSTLLDDNVHAYLSKLDLRVAAHATEASPENNTASTSSKYDLVSSTFRADQNVVISDARNGTSHIIWTSVLHLARPRVRLQRAAVYFTATLSVQPGALANQGHQAELLKDFEPLPSNVLEPLRWDPMLSDSGIYLSDSRIIKVAPRTLHAQDIVKPIRGSSKRAIPVVPAVFSRVRYSLIPDATIASLHIEASKLALGPVSIEGASFGVASYQVQNLTHESWPIELHPGNELVVLYRLPVPEKNRELSGENESSVFITINASASPEPRCSTKIHVCWQTRVDLSMSFERPSYRWSKSLTAGPSHTNRAFKSISSRPTSSDTSSGKANNPPSLILTFSGPQTTHCNQTFRLTVNCKIRSHRARRFGLIILPCRRNRTNKPTREGGSPADFFANLFNRAISDEILPPCTLSLNAEASIGPFSPGACFQTAIKFRAVSIGLLNLGTLRIVDIDSQQTVDVKELLDVVALDNLASNA